MRQVSYFPTLDSIEEHAPYPPIYFTYEEVQVNDVNSNNEVNANENESQPRPRRRNSFERLRQKLPKVDNLIDSIISVNTHVMKFLVNNGASGGASGRAAHPELPAQLSQVAQPSEQSDSSTSSQPASSATFSCSSSSSASSWSLEDDLDDEYSEIEWCEPLHPIHRNGARRRTTGTTRGRRTTGTRKSSFEYPHRSNREDLAIKAFFERIGT